MSLRDELRMDFESQLVMSDINRMFKTWDQSKPPRMGLHASSIVAPDNEFCFREQVMSLFFKRSESLLPIHTLRIFLHGWVVHEKWQNLFMSMGVGETVEVTRKSKMWDVFLTPDAVIRLRGKRYIVEIKTMNTHYFQKLKGPPANAIRQCNFYMHNLGIPRGIILVEDKNTQAVKVWVVDYDPVIAKIFISRLYMLKKFIRLFTKKQKLPKRICASHDVSRAKYCPLREACFSAKSKRAEFLLKDDDK